MLGDKQYAFITRHCHQIYSTSGALDKYLFPDEVLQFQIVDETYIVVRTLQVIYLLNLDSGKQLILLQYKRAPDATILVKFHAQLFQSSIWIAVIQYGFAKKTELRVVQFVPAQQSHRVYGVHFQSQNNYTHIWLELVACGGQTHYYVILKGGLLCCLCTRFKLQ